MDTHVYSSALPPTDSRQNGAETPYPHLDVLGVFADVHRLVGVSQHVDLDHAVAVVLDLKVDVREQEELVRRLPRLGDDLLNLQMQSNMSFFI
jgi:hypothetical protein